VRWITSMLLILVCGGCTILEPFDYDECTLTYTVQKNAHTSSIAIRVKKLRPKEGILDAEKDPKKTYQVFADVASKVLGTILCAPDGTTNFPEFEKLPGDALFTAEEVPLESSLLGAFETWDHTLIKKGKQYSLTFEPSKESAETTPWDLLCLKPTCTVISHNADEVDEKTGELRWKIERGKRKEKISFTLELLEAPMKRGG